jgi:hypothetical protein
MANPSSGRPPLRSPHPRQSESSTPRSKLRQGPDSPEELSGVCCRSSASAIAGRTRPSARWRRFAQALALNGGIGQSRLLGRFGGGRLALGGMLMAMRDQLLASLATACRPPAGLRLALPRRITTVTCLSLYTLGHLCTHAYPVRLRPKAQPAEPSGDPTGLQTGTASVGLPSARAASEASVSSRFDRVRNTTEVSSTAPGRSSGPASRSWASQLSRSRLTAGGRGPKCAEGQRGPDAFVESRTRAPSAG